MKKLAILIATMLMLCVMATACGGDADKSADNNSTSSTTTATAGGSVSTTASTTASASTSTTSTGTVTPPTGSTVATSMVSTEVAVGNFANGTELANGFFANGGSKDIVVDESTSGVSFGSYTAVLKRIKLGGAMDATKKNSIKFTVDKACTLTVYAKGGNSTDATRAGWVINEAGAQVGEVSAPFPTSSSPAMAMFDIPAAGTYYFGGNVNGINVYAMSIS